MQKLPTKISMVLVSVFGVAVLGAIPVSALHGLDDSSSGSSTAKPVEPEPHTPPHDNSGKKTTSSTIETTHKSGSSEVETEHATTGDNPTSHVSDLRARANKLLAAERADRKDKKILTAEERLKVCQARQTKLNNKITQYNTQAQKHLTVFNGIYTKVQAFQTEKQLSVSNYAGLIAAADAKKALAADAVNALKTVGVNIDCASADPAASIATVQTAVKNAKQALQDYRVAIKNIVVALQAAKTSKTEN